MRYLFLFALLFAQAAAAQTLVGRVVRVEEGDLLTVQDARRRHLKVRLAGIDAPERLQHFGPQARTSLAALVNNREVEIVAARPDSTGRLVARVLAADPNCNHPDCPKIHDIGRLQLMAGMAWWDRQSATGLAPQEREDYEIEEFNAKLRRLGLWADKKPVPPWEWRGR